VKYYQKCVKFACSHLKNSSASGGLGPVLALPLVGCGVVQYYSITYLYISTFEDIIYRSSPPILGLYSRKVVDGGRCSIRWSYDGCATSQYYSRNISYVRSS